MLKKARDELKLNYLKVLLREDKKPPDEKIYPLQNLKPLKLLIIFHLSIITALIIFSCRERVTPPDIPQYIPPILLAVEDTSCTDAFIRIRTTKAFESGVLQLRREGSTRVEIADLNSHFFKLNMQITFNNSTTDLL